MTPEQNRAILSAVFAETAKGNGRNYGTGIMGRGIMGRELWDGELWDVR